VHGDEGLPYVFVAGSESLPNFTPEQAAAQKRFSDDFKIASPDFQDVHGYGESPYSEETLTMGSPHITHAFGCLSLTLELPFKDNANDPDPQVGWDGARSARLGAAVLQPVLQSIRALK
jgi:murein tripeptide amidase MpaA